MREKPVEWLGGSLEDVRGFPAEARREAGHDLFLVQEGELPRDWKSIQTVGPGTNEVRIRTWSGGRLEHRVLYVAKFPEAVYVLHAFQKTSRTPSRQDLDTARQRYRKMLDRREKRS